MSKVSVIIPTYNRVEHLKETVDSVLKQSYGDFEIIVVDDGSTDDTKKTVKEIMKCSQKIRYIYQENSGVANARNKGIVNSKGEYVAFLDDDDRWESDKLELQVREMEKDRKVGLCSSKAYLEGAKPTSPKILPIITGSDYIDLLKINFICLSTALIRRECLDAVGLFRQEFSPSEDYDIWLRISRKYKISFIDKCLATYRKHSNNSTLDLEKSYLAHNRVLNSILLRKEDTKNRALIKKSIAYFYYMTARLCLEERAFKKTSKYFLKSVMYYPWVGLLMNRKNDSLFKIAVRLFLPYVGIGHFFLLSLIRKRQYAKS